MVTSWHWASGSTLSSTVTTASQVVTLPLLSVTVRVTGLSPIWSQLKLVWLSTRLAIPQASLEPLSTEVGATNTLPVISRAATTSWQSATGSTLSSTVTVAEQELILPLLSVTVNVTGLAPTLAQAKLVWLSTRLAIPQASLEPLSTAVAEVLPLPLTSNCTVTSWQRATGATLSSTVTVAKQEEELPLLSVTVSSTLTLPTWLQLKSVWLRLRLAIPQASLEPLFTAAAVVEPTPLASSCTVTFWQRATGFTLSSTVTVAEQVLTFPFTSVTVKVTGLPPTWLQSNEVWLSEMDAIPQASLEPLFTAAAVVDPFPAAFSWTVTS